MRRGPRVGRWAALVLFGITVATVASGCLRRRYDLCAESPPHAECPSDAGTDAPADAPVGADAGASSDAAGDDAP